MTAYTPGSFAHIQAIRLKRLGSIFPNPSQKQSQPAGTSSDSPSNSPTPTRGPAVGTYPPSAPKHPESATTFSTRFHPPTPTKHRNATGSAPYTRSSTTRSSSWIDGPAPRRTGFADRLLASAKKSS